jgi:hypothetical protein
MAGADAKAYPRKKFFYEMFTRDISLEDCILDLIDNSIDSLTRMRKLDLKESILSRKLPKPAGDLPHVRVKLSENEISIVDNCGGIERQDAIEEVFCFGHSNGTTGQLGVYGIGLKRAIFKLADNVEIKSQTTSGGFTASIDVKEWAERDEDLDDWRIPISFIAGATSSSHAGTSIKFTNLRGEVKMRLGDGALLGRMRAAIGQTYTLFLNREVRVSLDQQSVDPQPLPLGQSDQVNPAHLEFPDGPVTVTVIASLADRTDGEWRQERAGWYVLCNGRVVVTADKSDLTGWGAGLPGFHSKYSGFVGIALFQSDDLLSLPWTTTKRGLNRESPIYQRARKEMCVAAKPIISFLNKMYPSELVGAHAEREIAETIGQADIRTIVRKQKEDFRVRPKELAQTSTTVRIQYDARIPEIAKIKKHLRKPTWSARQVGRFTFDHFLKTECPE